MCVDNMFRLYDFLQTLADMQLLNNDNVLLADAEGTGGADLQRKLDMLNGALDAERAEQARRQLQYIAHCE